MQRIKKRTHHLLWALLAALALVSSACAGIVVEPIDETGASGVTRFWGYAISSGQTLNLEALNSSGQWEIVATGTSGTTPTHVGTHSGYYFAVDYNPVTAPVRFRKPSPWSGWARIHFRINTPNLGAAETRKYNPTSTPPSGIESNLERAWATHRGDGVIRIDIDI